MHEHQCHQEVIRQFLENNIIRESKNAQYVGTIFIIKKGSKSERPVFNYSKLSPHLEKLNFVLPSIFQLVRKYDWSPNMWYGKIDIKQAFFNISIHEKFKPVTFITYHDKYYEVNYLPMGIGVAPFIRQQFINCKLSDIRKTVKFAWGHIDDRIIGDEDYAKVQTTLKRIVKK